MEFDEEDNKIKIKDKWYRLCVCVNCKRVSAYDDVNAYDNVNNSLRNVDNKICCCSNADNHWFGNDARKIIKEFMDKWR